MENKYVRAFSRHFTLALRFMRGLNYPGIIIWIKAKWLQWYLKATFFIFFFFNYVIRTIIHLFIFKLGLIVPIITFIINITG